MISARFLLLGSCLGAVTACAGPSGIEQREQPILGGRPSERSEVVRLSSTGGTYPRACSGTLVAPNLVLTARHCISVFTDGEFACDADGTIDESVRQVPATAGDMGFLYSFDQVAVFVGQTPDESQPPAAIGEELIAPDTDTICRNDIAFVVLDRELDLPLRDIHLGRVVPNEEVIAVGYGTNETALVTRYEKDLQVIAVGPSALFPSGVGALPRTFSVGYGPCPGDSGGPAISPQTGAILGVYSLVRGSCSSTSAVNVYTHVGSFEGIVREAFRAAGHEELIDPPSGTGGAAGGEGGMAGGGGDVEPGGRSGCALAAQGVFHAGSRRTDVWATVALALAGALARRLSKRERCANG